MLKWGKKNVLSPGLEPWTPNTPSQHATDWSTNTRSLFVYLYDVSALYKNLKHIFSCGGRPHSPVAPAQPPSAPSENLAVAGLAAASEPKAITWPPDLSLPAAAPASNDSVTVYRPVSSDDLQGRTWTLSVGTGAHYQVQRHPVNPLVYAGVPVLPNQNTPSGWTTFTSPNSEIAPLPPPAQSPVKHPQSLQQQQRAALRQALEARGKLTLGSRPATLPDAADINRILPAPSPSPSPTQRPNSKVVRSSSSLFLLNAGFLIEVLPAIQLTFLSWNISFENQLSRSESTFKNQEFLFFNGNKLSGNLCFTLKKVIQPFYKLRWAGRKLTLLLVSWWTLGRNIANLFKLKQNVFQTALNLSNKSYHFWKGR